MTYLAVTAINRSNRTETVHGTSSTDEERARAVDTEFLSRAKSIEPFTSKPAATGMILETRTGLEAEPGAAHLIIMSNAGTVAESRENESGSATGQFLFEPRPTTFER